jgi:competence protein ComEC
MPLFALCALAGAYALQLCGELPGPIALAVLAVTSIAAILVRRIRLVGACMAGFVLLAGASHVVVADRVPAEFAGTTIRVDLEISDFPKERGAATSFLAEPLNREDLPRRIRVSWFGAPARPMLGEIWQLDLRLRRPRGFSNPGGFDYEGWLFRQAIGATGYVVGGGANIRRRDAVEDRVAEIRRRFVARVRDHLPDDDAAAVLTAIGVGARQFITAEQWSRYAATGTSHLMAISGLHIGLAAGGMYLIAWGLLGIFCRRGNLRDLASIVAAFAACAYAEISGLAIPARRALLMTIVIVLAGLMRRQASPARILSICCVGILFSDPVAILSPGFKLSFAAVAILCWHLQTTRPQSAARRSHCLSNGARRLFSLQLALLFGLSPLTALLFDRVSLVAPVVNLFALPVFSFLAVPACLLGLVLDGPLEAGGDLVLAVAHRSIGLVLWLVRQAAQIPFTSFHVAGPRGLSVVFFLLPLLWPLLPPGWPGRRLAVVAVFALIHHRPTPPPRGCLDLHALDVGQGLSLVLRTRRHAAVYDTGPSFLGGSDTGQLVVVPFLRNEGIASIDTLIVSHADQDHAGGARSLTESVETARVLSGEVLDDFDLAYSRCQTSERWNWDGIRFRIVHPQDPGRWRGNNASCVLEIGVAEHSVILTGDIEAPVESLLTDNSTLTSADVVLIPHHGSRTSSSPRFIAALEPKVAIVSAGFENRWGFPKEEIVAAWRNAGAEVLNTATAGAISYRLCRDDGMRRLGLHRYESRRYWHE